MLTTQFFFGLAHELLSESLYQNASRGFFETILLRFLFSFDVLYMQYNRCSDTTKIHINGSCLFTNLKKKWSLLVQFRFDWYTLKKKIQFYPSKMKLFLYVVTLFSMALVVSSIYYFDWLIILKMNHFNFDL